MMTKHNCWKTTFFSSAFSMAILLLLVSTNSFSQKRLAFQMNIDGSKENYAGKELKLSDFGLLTIKANDEDMKVEQFDITLARGPRAVQNDEKVWGNSFDMRSYSEIAREGDRIVIRVLEVSKKLGSESTETVDLPVEESTILTIPISFGK